MKIKLVWLLMSGMDRKQIQISVKHLGFNKPSDYQRSLNNLEVVGDMANIKKKKKKVDVEFYISKSRFDFAFLVKT